MKRLLSRSNPGLVLIAGAVLIVLGIVVGGVIGLFGVGFARGAQRGWFVGFVFALFALAIAAIASRAQKRDKKEHD